MQSTYVRAYEHLGQFAGRRTLRCMAHANRCQRSTRPPAEREALRRTNPKVKEIEWTALCPQMPIRNKLPPTPRCRVYLESLIEDLPDGTARSSYCATLRA